MGEVRNDGLWKVAAIAQGWDGVGASRKTSLLCAKRLTKL
jgi:hypothetical protein